MRDVGKRALEKIVSTICDLLHEILNNVKYYVRQELTQLIIHKKTLTVADYKKIQTYNEILQNLK